MGANLFTQEEANILTPEGFAAYVNKLRVSMTHVNAYEAAEKVHQRVHHQGKRKYNEFSSYERLVYLNKKRCGGCAVGQV